MSTKQESKTTVSHLPEHGPIDENGREILLQVKNVDITFGKGDDAVKAVLKFPARFRIPWTGRLSETFRWYSRILPHR